MVKVYFNGEMTMLKRYVPNWIYVTYTIFRYEISFL